MRAFLILSLVLAACSPRPQPEPPNTPPAVHPLPTEVREAATTEKPAIHGVAPPATRAAADTTPRPAPTQKPGRVRAELDGIRIEAVHFDARSHTLRVRDQPGGPGSRWPDSRSAGRAAGAMAAINGGFFTPEGEPIGLVIDSGKRAGAFNRASSLASGFYFASPSGRPELVRRGSFSEAPDALQSGPFLVENGMPVDGLKDERPAVRCFLATDGGNRWILARSGATTLARLAKALAGRSIAGVRIGRALNLDGGRSAELWTDSSLDGGPSFTRPLWNKPVRNYLVLQPR